MKLLMTRQRSSAAELDWFGHAVWTRGRSYGKIKGSHFMITLAAGEKITMHGLTI